MNTQMLMSAAKGIASQIGFIFKKHAPEICLGGGTIAVVIGTVVACKQTLNMPDILDKTKEEVNGIHAIAEAAEREAIKHEAEPEVEVQPYTNAQMRKDLTKAYIRCGLRVAKNYAIPFALEAGGLGLIFGGHKILKDRNTNLALVAAATDKAFSEYRKRVEEKYGKQADNDIYYGDKKEEVIVEKTDKKGETKEVKKTVKAYNDPVGPYSKLFCEGVRGWCKDGTLALLALQDVQRWANDRLYARGYLYLNEILEYLCIPETEAGAVKGWVVDPEDPYKTYVSLNLDENREDIQNFVNGWTDSMWITFNVQDGPVLYKALKFRWIKPDYKEAA